VVDFDSPCPMYGAIVIHHFRLEQIQNIVKRLFTQLVIRRVIPTIHGATHAAQLGQFQLSLSTGKAKVQDVIVTSEVDAKQSRGCLKSKVSVPFYDVRTILENPK
jgi:hypothetical protein